MTQTPSVCALQPASVVNCKGKPGDPCADSVCNQVTGACDVTPTGDGEACSDGSQCTVLDVCLAGQCVPGANQCACTKTSDCQDDGNPCTLDGCTKGKGCDAVQAGNAGAPSDDAKACTNGDACVGMACVGQAGGCDDGNPCTDDTCAIASNNCTFTANPAPCSDGRRCVARKCGGCEAFRRRMRARCERVLWPPYDKAKLPPVECQVAAPVDRDEIEDVALLSAARDRGRRWR